MLIPKLNPKTKKINTMEPDEILILNDIGKDFQEIFEDQVESIPSNDIIAKAKTECTEIISSKAITNSVYIQTGQQTKVNEPNELNIKVEVNQPKETSHNTTHFDHWSNEFKCDIEEHMVGVKDEYIRNDEVDSYNNDIRTVTNSDKLCNSDDKTSLRIQIEKIKLKCSQKQLYVKLIPLNVCNNDKSTTAKAKQSVSSVYVRKSMRKLLPIENGSPSSEFTYGSQRFELNDNCRQTSVKTNPTWFYCSECTYKAASKKNIKAHIDNTHSPRFSCKFCNKSFTRKQQYDDHLLWNHREEIDMSEITHKIYKCSKCDVQTVLIDRLRLHLKKHTKVNGFKKFECELCNFTTYVKYSFKKHLLIHSSDRPYACAICSISFPRKQQMDSHIVRTHPKNDSLMATITNKVHQCQQCSYKSIIRVNFKVHMLRHNEIPRDLQRFNCNQCNYSCYNKRNYLDHVLIHSGTRPFECTICIRSFIRKRDIDSHIVNIHRDDNELMASVTSKVHECQQCTYKNVRGVDLRHHIQMFHKQNNHN